MEIEFKEKIKHVLSQLDEDNDDHWTEEGVPLMSAVHAVAGDNGITRANLLDAAPLFTRENRVFDLPPEPNPEDPDEPPIVANPETDLDTPSPDTETEAQIFKRLTVLKDGIERDELPPMEDYDQLILILHYRVTKLRDEAARLNTNAQGLEPQLDLLVRVKEQAYPVMSKDENYQEHLRLHKEHDAKAAKLREKDPLAALATGGNQHLSPIDTAARASGGENRGMRSQTYVPPQV